VHDEGDEMRRPIGLLRRGRELTLLAARNSQALVIVVTDRAARNAETGDARVIGRLWAFQLNVAELVIGEPVSIADEGYQHVQRLVELHREFAHRLFEAFDTRDLLTSSGPATSNVIQMPSRLG
jgi:hypothetical protein